MRDVGFVRVNLFFHVPSRHRIALACALAVDPPIAALDEVGSAMDSATQQELADMLRELACDRTVIAATHSLPTLLAADRIYRLENGRLTEEYIPSMLAEDGESESECCWNQKDAS